MNICKDDLSLFGKIKYCSLPLFDISKIESDLLLFKKYIMEKLNLELGHFYIKPPQPNTVLGRFIETIRFPNGLLRDLYSKESNENSQNEDSNINDLNELKVIKDIKKSKRTNKAIQTIKLTKKDQESIIRKIELGFGENGYYYDIQLCPLNLSLGDYLAKFNEALKYIEILEERIENDLSEYYFKQTDENNIKEIQSISNFDISIENNTSLLPVFIPNFVKIIETLGSSSESIVKGQSNKVQPIMRLQIYSEMMYSEPMAYKRAEKYLEQDRFFEIQQLDNENKWRFIGRGIPVSILINILSNFNII